MTTAATTVTAATAATAGAKGLKGRALLFGLNYEYAQGTQLNGCINDVKNMAGYLKSVLGIPSTIITDDVDRDGCNTCGILKNLYELAVDSHRMSLDFVWIHYSGHGSYIVDRSGDEADGNDECLVPSDFMTAGLLPDDVICSVLNCFNPKTRVICVFDCCHSGTIGDVKYSWEGPRRVKVENILNTTDARVITLSGCLDTQTSADAYNVSGDKKYTGALTSCLLMVLQELGAKGRENVFLLLDALRAKLKLLQFDQVPKLCSTHNIAKDPLFIPFI